MFSNNKQVVRVCKVCKDAGKTEAEYTSHFVRSDPGPKGVVVCPTLLNAECSYCRTFGHTRAYCVQLLKQQKIEDRVAAKETYVKAILPKVSAAGKLNRFAAFDDEDDQDEKANDTRHVSMPIINKPMLYKQPVLSGYAKAAATAPQVIEKPKPVLKQAPVITNKVSEMDFPVVKREERPLVCNPLVKGFVRSWADYTDSDTESDTDVEY